MNDVHFSIFRSCPRCNRHLVLLKNVFVAPGGTASGVSHGGITVLSSYHDSCLPQEGHVLTVVFLSPRGVLPGRRILAPTFLIVPCETLDTSLVPTLTPCSSDAAREVCRESARFCQARGPLLPACGRLARSARLCTPRPSRRFAKRTMEQCALAFLGTIAFLPPHVVKDGTVFTSSSCALGCICDLVLDLSRLLGLAPRPFAPVFRCHRETFDALEAGTYAGSRAWNFSSSSVCFFCGRRCA